MLLFVILGVAIAITLFIVFQITVVRPIRDLRTDIASITGSMDYSMRAQIRNQDEIGALSRDFNTMLGLIEANNQELKQLSETDPLTGLFNRLAMDKKLQQAWHLLIRTSDPLTVMLVDIDYFKAYNDHFGHQQGDEAIRQQSSILRGIFKRETDIIGRYGGEEFVVVLSDVNEEQLKQSCQKILLGWEETNLAHAPNAAHPFISCSIGAVITNTPGDASIDSLIDVADKALYEAKDKGKACYELAVL